MLHFPLQSLRRNVSRRAGALPLCLLLAATLTPALGGCGSSGAGPDPASVVPAAAPLYLSAVVQPTGSLKDDALRAGRRLTGQSNPYAGLVGALQAPGGRELDFGRDVKPWLGSRAGLFLASLDVRGAGKLLTGRLSAALARGLAEGLGGSASGLLGEGGAQGLLGAAGAQGALVLAVGDSGKARAFLQARAQEVGAHPGSYRGVAYRLAADGTAWGLVGQFAVIGSEAGLKGVVDTERGGAALLHAGPYAKLSAGAESGALANAYLSPGALLGADASSSTGSTAEEGKGAGKAGSVLSLLRGALGGAGQAYLSLLPSSQSIALDIDTLPASSGAQTSPGALSAASAQVAGRLPGDSWLAAGVADVGAFDGTGEGLRSLSSLVGKINLGALNLGGLLAPLSSSEIDIKRDLLSWIDSAGVFAGGSGLLNLQAGVVLGSKDPALSNAAVGKLARAYRAAGGEVTQVDVVGAETAVTVKLKGFPIVLAIAAGAGKLALGLGPTSAQEALNPSTTLASSPVYRRAAALLGHGIQPSLIVEFPTLVALLEALGLSRLQGISSVMPSLQSLSTLTAGGGESLGGGVTRARVVLGLTQSG